MYLINEAKAFITQYYDENQKCGLEARLAEVHQEIAATGTYTHTYDELSYGSKLAWRNSNRCIGRLFWRTLKVLDCRSVKEEAGFLESLHQHLKIADHNTSIRNTITIFSPLTPDNDIPVFSIRNYTLLMYAGHEVEGKIVGDPARAAFTKHCKSLGWKGAGTAFDLLPVVYSVNGGPDQFYELPKDLVTEISIEHPTHTWVAKLGLKWYKLPIISSMKLEIGGLTYPTGPFNGWYMLDEIATRNFADKERYNLLPVIAEQMGLDTTSPFWKEYALLVLNEAVYHSYRKVKANIVDHHTAVEQFMQFMQQETDKGREVTGDWTWLIPPTSSSLTDIFHTPMKNKIKYPNFVA
ncbi:MAG: nitric oxide synthase oxygenase [Bacteroidota bacterium]